MKRSTNFNSIGRQRRIAGSPEALARLVKFLASDKDERRKIIADLKQHERPVSGKEKTRE